MDPRFKSNLKHRQEIIFQKFLLEYDQLVRTLSSDSRPDAVWYLCCKFLCFAAVGDGRTRTKRAFEFEDGNFIRRNKFTKLTQPTLPPEESLDVLSASIYKLRTVALAALLQCDNNIESADEFLNKANNILVYFNRTIQQVDALLRLKLENVKHIVWHNVDNMEKVRVINMSPLTVQVIQSEPVKQYQIKKSLLKLATPLWDGQILAYVNTYQENAEMEVVVSIEGDNAIVCFWDKSKNGFATKKVKKNTIQLHVDQAIRTDPQTRKLITIRDWRDKAIDTLGLSSEAPKPTASSPAAAKATPAPEPQADVGNKTRLETLLKSFGEPDYDTKRYERLQKTLQTLSKTLSSHNNTFTDNLQLQATQLNDQIIKLLDMEKKEFSTVTNNTIDLLLLNVSTLISLAEHQDTGAPAEPRVVLERRKIRVAVLCATNTTVKSPEKFKRFFFMKEDSRVLEEIEVFFIGPALQPGKASAGDAKFANAYQVEINKFRGRYKFDVIIKNDDSSGCKATDQDIATFIQNYRAADGFVILYDVSTIINLAEKTYNSDSEAVYLQKMDEFSEKTQLSKLLLDLSFPSSSSEPFLIPVVRPGKTNEPKRRMTIQAPPAPKTLVLPVLFDFTSRKTLKFFIENGMYNDLRVSYTQQQFGTQSKTDQSIEAKLQNLKETLSESPIKHPAGHRRGLKRTQSQQRVSRKRRGELNFTPSDTFKSFVDAFAKQYESKHSSERTFDQINATPSFQALQRRKDETFIRKYKNQIAELQNQVSKTTNEERKQELISQIEFIRDRITNVTRTAAAAGLVSKATPEINIVPSVFRGLGKPGDFSFEISQPGSDQTLFIFNDNVQDHLTKNPGGGNAVIRPNNFIGQPDFPRAAGVCTSLNSADEDGYQTLIPQTTKRINKNISEIESLLEKHNYTTVKYNSDEEGIFATEPFNVNPAVKQYITDKIHELGTLQPVAKNQ
ncbi:MAG: hypothetical protein CL678_09110 [Bdellovibrionaceae bacterium]|nr:hypothetical protein [Pseudobdellovibrionaceae bacterium]